ncbi:MAG: bifunctional phosphoglucose/phosphomannose isomerase [Candidatus Micrarchaeota archaeon]|nr:bifunctional phosphoglucose/phosphomannose isomerase [Candidatus Micrarchaeota archaeon]
MDFREQLLLLKEQLLFKDTIRDIDSFDNIVIAGMGGSGIVGKIFQELYSEKPVYLVDDYKCPTFVSRKSLFIAISYSGNTEETISALAQAKAKRAYTVSISAGGKLSGYAEQSIKIPNSELQPRCAIGYMLMPLIRSFSLANSQEITKAYKLLMGLDDDSGECEKHAKRICSSSRIPVIYGVSPFKSVAYRWKTQFNENGKVLAYSSSFPELNHNDTMALAETYDRDRFYFFVFESGEEKISKRIAVTARITGAEFNMIEPKGTSTFEKLFYLIHYGDYVSYHLGLLRKIDPADVSLIQRLKKMIA